jgi:hypothetical protein
MEAFLNFCGIGGFAQQYIDSSIMIPPGDIIAHKFFEEFVRKKTIHRL